MEPYRTAAQGDPGLTVKLYDWNIRIGAAFFEDICIIEILLRNTLDSALRDRYQTEMDMTPWYDHDHALLTSSYKAVDVAKQEVRDYLGLNDDKEPDQDDVIARLGFGFWLMLLNRQHESKLGTIIKPCFTYASGKAVYLDVVSTKVGDLYEMRNAIAHHHPIFHWDFDDSATNVLYLAEWMSQPLRAWLFQRSRVVDVLKENPLR